MQTTFKVNAEKSGRLILEGDANVSTVVDRVNDVIEPGEWKLDNYKANPIVLFNHDISLPLGRAEEVKVDEKGLWVKCIIEKDEDNPVIKSVYKKIKSGIIKAFSVRVTSQDVDVRKGVNYLKSVELIEVTVTPLPVNQASTFSLAKHVKTEVKELTEAINGLRQDFKSFKKELVSNQQGSSVADDQSVDTFFKDINSRIDELGI